MKVLIRSDKEAVLYMPNKAPFTLYSDKGNILTVVDEFLAPVDQSNFNTLSEYNVALTNSMEDTQIVQLFTNEEKLALYYAELCM